jgi:hypothetical protein
MNNLFKKITLLAFVFIFLACSKTKTSNQSNAFGNKDFADAFVSQIKPRWFTAVDRFALLDQNKKPVAHRFFDVKPFRNIKLKTLNTVIVTPEGSDYLNQIDLPSGQIFTDKKFCSQVDEYKKVNTSVFKPNFSIGILPRVLDQLNLPQKVIVFGSGKYFKKYHLTHHFDVRVVGGYIERTCPYGGCFRTDQWLSRLVLVGVQNGNQDLSSIQSIKDIQKKYDWKYSQAFIENGEGKNMLAGKFYPRKKMGALVGANEALKYIDKNSTIFTIDKLKKMRMSCFKLYDHLWKDLSSVNASAKKASTAKEIREKAIDIKLKKKKGIRDFSFSRRFSRNIKKFGDQFKTCSKYIYSSNINDDPKRHWLFAYMTSFYKLQELGYAYNCSSKSWDANPIISKGRRMRSLQAQFSNCVSGDLDRAFEFAPIVLDNIRKKRILSYRYIDYDKGLTGTHLKIYNWVKERPGVMSCSSEADRDYNLNKRVFPLDIKWERRGTDLKNKRSNGIIF